MLKVIAGVETTARHKSIGGADGSGIAERNLYVVIIILLKEGIGKDAEDVTAVVVPVFGHELGSNLLQLVGKTFFTGHAKAIFQSCGNSVLMLVFVLPKIKAARVLSAARIGNIKHIFEPWIVAGCVNQSDTFGATTDISAHLLVPKVIVGTGGCVWLLSENHQLLVERVLIQPSHCFKERRPLTEAACDLPCCSVCHL
ncbi:MAG: hypothetical protein GX625_18925 [Clostridiaceae bacterium]|nr:hypothetical protein [Clostridiaceae bacterium]